MKTKKNDEVVVGSLFFSNNFLSCAVQQKTKSVETTENIEGLSKLPLASAKDRHNTMSQSW